MPAKQGKTFQDIMKDLKARRFSPIYILMGEEAYYIDQITNYIAENVLTPAEQDFNLNICFGADVSAVQVTDMAKRFSNDGRISSCDSKRSTKYSFARCIREIFKKSS